MTPLALQVLPLPHLLFSLAGNRKTVPSVPMAEAELEKERFLFRPDLLCKWHAAHTDTNFCSSATVRRWSYVVMDLVCSDYNIELVGGRHIPRGLEIKTPVEISPPQSYGKSRKLITHSGRSRAQMLESGYGALDIRELTSWEVLSDNLKLPEGDHKVVPEAIDVDNMEIVVKDTISDYMSNMTISNISVESDSSGTDGAEYHSLVSFTSASETGLRLVLVALLCSWKFMEEELGSALLAW